MYFDESDQAGIVAALYSTMTPESRLKIFGEPEPEQEYPIESYRFIVLDITDDAQNNYTSSRLPV